MAVPACDDGVRRDIPAPHEEPTRRTAFCQGFKPPFGCGDNVSVTVDGADGIALDGSLVDH
jgi:hypothetical protein